MALSQLGVAYVEVRDLKNQIESLRQENEELKSQLARISVQNTGSTGTDETTSEVSTTDGVDVTRGRDDSTKDARELTSAKTVQSASKSKKQEETQTRLSNQVDRVVAKLLKDRAEELLFTIDPTKTRHLSGGTIEKADSPAKNETDDVKKQPNTGKQRVKKVIVEEVDDTNQDVTDISKRSSGEGQGDETILTLIDVSIAFFFFFFFFF